MSEPAKGEVPKRGWIPVIDGDEFDATEYLRVGGGWLVRTRLYDGDGGGGTPINPNRCVSLVFVQDHGHLFTPGAREG